VQELEVQAAINRPPVDRHRAWAAEVMAELGLGG
jgi:hypothetical protein